MFTSTHPFEHVDARVEALSHAYAVVTAAQKVNYPLTATTMLRHCALEPQDSSQSWRDNKFMQGTGEGFFKKRDVQGTRIDKVLAEPRPQPDFTPWIMTVTRDATTSMLYLAYVRDDDRVDELFFKPAMQDAVNQPVDTLKEGDTVVCFQEHTEDEEVGFDDLKFYAIKLAITSEITTSMCHRFLKAYQQACQSYNTWLLSARMTACTDSDNAIKARKLKALEAEKEAERKRGADVALLEQRCEQKRKELAELEADLSAKRARA